MSDSDLLTRIETRRFVGRELLVWLWLESEIYEGTLCTKEHGSFGLWLVKRIVLSRAKEITQIKGEHPAATREAKEALSAGKLPERAGIQLELGEREYAFELAGDTLALSGLVLPAVLHDSADEEPGRVRLDGDRPAPRKRKKSVSRDESDEAYEAFYERMHLTEDVEAVLGALYRDFLAMRLDAAWARDVVPMLVDWARGKRVDESRYSAARKKVLGRVPR